MKQLATKPYNRISRYPRTHHFVPRGGAAWSTRSRPPDEGDIFTFLRDITQLYEGGNLSKQQYDQLVRLACSVYVQQAAEKYLGDFENRVGEFLEKTLSPERLARLLSPSH